MNSIMAHSASKTIRSSYATLQPIPQAGVSSNNQNQNEMRRISKHDDASSSSSVHILANNVSQPTECILDSRSHQVPSINILPKVLPIRITR
jgi:hypothetical protein